MRRFICWLLVVVACMGSWTCSAAVWAGIAQGLSESQAPAQQAATPAPATSSYSLLDAVKCPTCGMSMNWTGASKVEWGKFRYLYRCPAGHQYYFNSPSERSQRTTATTTTIKTMSPSVTCPTCGMMAMWTGKTYTEWGKLHYVYKCVAGHESVVVQ